MCDETSPCDLRAVSRADKSDDFERWSIADAEARNPHYRYRIVCSKWGLLQILGQGYRYGEARALAKVLMEFCAEARPREDSWTRPIFRLERISPLIRQRQEVGDLAFVEHENYHRFRADGSLESYTLRKLLVTIEAVSDSGEVQRVRSLSGLVLENPTVKMSFASDDIDIERFTEHLSSKLADCSPLEAYEYLTSPSVLVEKMELFARNEIKRTPFDTRLAATCMRHVGLPEGHKPPNISVDLLDRQIAAILTPSFPQQLAA